MNELTKPGRQLANQQLLIALILVILITILTYFCWGFSYAISAFAGGSIAIIPNFIFARKAFKYAGARAAKKVVDSFYGGVKLKMLVTALLFALCFKFINVLPLPFFTTFLLMLTVPFIWAIGRALVHKFTFNQL